MGREIERKFLLASNAWKTGSSGIDCVQGYIAASPSCVVRVRILGAQGYLTLKGPTSGFERSEYEYPVPVEEAREMLEHFCVKPLIRKTRYTVTHAHHQWEVDIFHDENEGLVLAEIELDEPAETFDLPSWAGEEVTDLPEYRNSNLVKHPYCLWRQR